MGCLEIVIREPEKVAKTQFVCCYYYIFLGFTLKNHIKQIILTKYLILCFALNYKIFNKSATNLKTAFLRTTQWHPCIWICIMNPAEYKDKADKDSAKPGGED